jgi:hypothetical protein
MQRLVLGFVFVVLGCGSSGGGDDGDDGADDAPDDPDAAVGPSCGDGVCDAGESSISCPDDCPASCGNGTCEPAESAASCPGDCDPTACTTAPDTCTGDNLCIAGHCEFAFGRLYTVRVLGAMLTEQNANGDSWDPLGGLPDPLVTITLNGTTAATPRIDDTLMPTWDFDLPAMTIPGGSTFRVAVNDFDQFDGDDLMFACEAMPLSADFLRQGLTCNAGAPLDGAHVELTFTPN